MENVEKQIIEQNQRLLQNLNTQRHCHCEVNQLIGEITGRKIPASTEIRLPFYTEFGRNIKIGENVFIGPGLTAEDKAGIIIESDVQIGAGVCLLSDDPALNPGKIIIKKGARIGARSVIYPGVTIEEDAVIKPASIIKLDIERKTIK